MNVVNTKQELLQFMERLGSGLTEHESDDAVEYMKNFLPVPSHRRVLEPSILLILGGRGAGKSALFRLLSMQSGREALLSQTYNNELPESDKEIWLSGFGRDRMHDHRFPTQESVERALKHADNYRLRSFWVGLWFGMIVQNERLILEFQNLIQEVPDAVLYKLKYNLTMTQEWLPLVEENYDKINSILDKLDEYLISKDKWMYVTYDELDRVSTSHTSLAPPIRELLAFWLDRWRRWTRIRPKIFLRTDLFREEFLGFPDASKLRPHQLQLEWSTTWLYQLLIKRLANLSETMKDYVSEVPGLIAHHDDTLGYIPSPEEVLHQQFMEHLVGKFMGADARKGNSHRWVPNHLQDAGGKIAPRSFLKLFSYAAVLELHKFDDKALTDRRLLQPSSLQGALMEASNDRIRELASEEYPWLQQLKKSLKGIVVPANKEQFIEAIERTEWSPMMRPPVERPIELMEYMKTLGILESRSDGRINMPEIYLYGFEMKRMGGVRRPK